MKTKKFVKLFALITVFALLFAACGAKEAAPAETVPETEAAAQVQPAVELGLTKWTMNATIWSGANGASVDLEAIPVAYADGMSAKFVVRLEGEDISSNPCEWNGTAFTSYADLNAEDGYCYYVILNDGKGAEFTVEVNTPTSPFDNSLIDLATSIESFGSTTISDAKYEAETLTILQGAVSIQVPRITTGGNAVTCTEARLILNLDGGALTQSILEVPAEVDDNGCYNIDLAGIAFTVPEMEGDHQITLSLSAELSNGQVLTDESHTAWFYSDGTVNMTVG